MQEESDEGHIEYEAQDVDLGLASRQENEREKRDADSEAVAPLAFVGDAIATADASGSESKAPHTEQTTEHQGEDAVEVQQEDGDLQGLRLSGVEPPAGIHAHSVPQVTPLAAVVLAAGAGSRLRPLTLLRPKALCPIDNVPLVDAALMRVGAVTDSVAVNVHHGRAAMEAHLARRVHLSIEEPQALGTAGALGHLRPWIDGRPTLVMNVDAWHQADLKGFVDGWDGERVRVLIADEAFGPRARVVASLLPWGDVAALEPVPSGLYERSWGPAHERALLDVDRYDGPFFDCGTPARYLAANLAASGGRSVIGPAAVVDGDVEESVVWPGAEVRAGERLRHAIRATNRLTVLVRQ